ncbi:MAG: CdaR family protein [Balneolaceae bacterium]
MWNKWKEILFSGKEVASAPEDDGMSSYLTREKILVFGISFILAFCLWFIVNLSRDFTISINLPIEISNLPEDRALVGEFPEYVSVGVTGEGWTLISLYNNPPRVMLDVSQEQIQLFERVQQQMSSSSGISVTQVEPATLQLQLEEKVTKRVPVVARTTINLRDQYGLIRDAVLVPDSVDLSGAASVLTSVDSVLTSEMTLDGTRGEQEIQLELEDPGQGITLEPASVLYRYEVAEFTEAEVRVPVRIRNLPPGRAVTYNPSTITVRYDVPIDQYSEVMNIRPFQAYVDYETIEADTTGLIIPHIEKITEEYQVRLRSFQPRTVSYFNVLEDQE